LLYTSPQIIDFADIGISWNAYEWLVKSMPYESHRYLCITTKRTHADAVEAGSVPNLDAAELMALREHLHLSRAVFARYLRAHQSAHLGELGTRPRQAQRSSSFVDSLGGGRIAS
jgi:hypothetical protein